MKYASVVAALCSVVSGSGACQEGMTLSLFEDAKCTKTLEGNTHEMTAEEAD